MRLCSNDFARQPADQVLESTVNADVASRQTGITSFMHIPGAVKRWMTTRSLGVTLCGICRDFSKKIQNHQILTKKCQDLGDGANNAILFEFC